ncbi:uncharacterized protein LOC141544751 isoform X3 [Sminthopsis crassicaudata]|uniref:uncharacterized protein LOC141544751 isoform X3 n=1 Tax=Sminthopsis crassicaudata TaxID=9301 RepID=UPI003D69A3A5
MKKIFNFGKKGQSSSSRFNLPSFFGSQPVYRTQGYLIQSKDLGKIHKAALRGDVVKVQQLLLLGKNTVNELDKMKRTPLHLACANGYPDVVSLLIERKCELDLLDNDNKTPLMKAIECQREECATILLEHGADPNLRDSHSNTLLHYIASGGNKFMAEKLIEHKIDIDAKNKEGRTPLMLAISARNIELADFLLKNGANVNAMDDSKRTALMIAVSVGMEALGLVTLLLQHNADHTLQDNDGWIAEKYAKLYGYPVNIYHKQIEDQKKQIEKEKEKIEKPKVKIEKQKEQIEKQKPCTPQISCSDKTSDIAPSLDKKEDGIVEDSISRFSDNIGSDKAWLSTDDELDFDTKKLPKLNLAKVLNAAHQITKIRGEGSRTVNTEDTAFLRDNQPDNEKDLTDSFSKSSSQAHCSHAVHPSPACFSQSSLMKSTLLDIKEYPTDSEEEAKENDVLVKNDTVKQISHEIPNIPDQLQEKCAERKTTISTLRLEEEEESRWDSECSTENLKGSARHLSSTNQSIKDSIPLRHEDLKQKSKFKESSDRNQERFDKRDQKQCCPKSVLERSAGGVLVSTNQNMKDSISLGQHEDTSSWDSTSPGDKNKNQQSLKVESSKHARKSPSKSSHNHGETTKTTNALFKNEKDTGSGSDPSYKFPAKKPGSEKPCEPPVRQEKEKQPLEDIPSWDSPNISKINDSHKSSRHSKLERKHDCNAAYVAKNIIKADSKVAINGIKEDRSFGTEMTFSQHRNIPSLLQSCGPGSHVQLTLSDNMKSINQDKKAELIKPRKCKKKTKHLETSSQSSLDNDYHSTYEVEEEKQKHQINGMETVEDKDVDKLTENRTVDKVNDQFAMESHQYGKDEENKIPGKKIPIMHISPKKNLAPVQHVSKGLVKNTPNEKNKDEVEMTSYALDDLTQSHNTDTEDYDLPPSNSVQGSPRLQRHQKVVLSCGLSVKHQNKSQLVQMTRVVKNSLQTTVRRSQEKFSKRRKTKSRSNHQKVKCDKEYYRGRLEGKKQNGGKTQSEIETNSSSVSSDILYEEHQPPELHLQREQEEWLLLEDQLIDKIDILSNKLSKAKNELYQRRDSLRMKTSILEKTQKELEMTKDKVKEFELSNHIQKEKLKKSSLKVESMQEKLTQKQREFALLQEISEDAQNKGAFKRRVLKSNWMNFRDRSLTVDASTEKQDHGVEERNKESTDEIIHLREQIRIYENEQAEDEDMIRKLQQELADSQKEESILSQKALEMKQLLKIYQMESEDMIRKLQQELADSQKEESMLSQKALEMKQLLKIYQMESEDMIRKLQQELADSQKEESMLSQKALEMKQLLKIYQMESELQESQEQKRETQQYNELEEHMQKFKMECATFENSGEQDENIWETINFYFKHIQDLKRQLDAAFSKFMQLELMNKIIQEESFSSKSLQKNHDKLERKKRNLKKLMLSII